MANLPDADRAAVWAEYIAENTDTNIAVTKADLRAAVNAIDAFMEANKVAMNNAIPQPARGALTAKQKARLLVHVIQRRWLTEA